jgi:hypothetical protein
MHRKISLLFVCCFLLISNYYPLDAQDLHWYTQGKFKPITRVEISLENQLDISRKNYPVIINRRDFPLPDVHEMWVTVVDPSLPPSGEPDAETLRIYGGHQIKKEANGHAIFHQLDDIDKDGIWDELVFITDMEPNEEKIIHVYIGENIRGWNRHYTHANIGSYCRHQMPFWETEYVGWKIWFANCLDVYAKREPVLMSQELYMQNLDGYGVSAINNAWGSDIQSVARSFGGGAVCLFENSLVPDSVSTPRFTPVQLKDARRSMFNAGQISDTRYAYEVVVNGPLRSMIRIKTMNWNTNSGSYAYDQYYTVYAHHSYCTSKVVFREFNPATQGVRMACGIRKKPQEEWFYENDGIIISAGPEGIRDPENIDDREEHVVDFIGASVVVKDEFKPEYQFVSERKGNHAFKVVPDDTDSFEFMLFAAWSEGAVLTNFEDFKAYTLDIALQFNNPLKIKITEIQDLEK